MFFDNFLLIAFRLTCFCIIGVFAPKYLVIFYFSQLVSIATYYIFRDIITQKKICDSSDMTAIFDLFVPGLSILFWVVSKIVKRLVKSPDQVTNTDQFTLREDDELTRNIISGEVSDFIGQIKYGDKNQKLRVMEEISKDPKEGMLDLLHMAMDDKEYEVRYYANNLILKIEAKTISDIKSLSEYIVKNPSDDELYLKRAKLYEKLAQLNQNEKHAYNLYLDKAQEDYAITMTLKMPEQETYFKVIEIFGKRKQFDMVLRYFNILKNMKIEIPENNPVYQTILEARFQLGL